MVLMPVYVFTGFSHTRGMLKHIYLANASLPSESVVYVAGDPYILFLRDQSGADAKVAIRYYE